MKIKIEEAQGRWVMLTGIGEEADAWGRITTLKSANEFIEFHVAEHPTCGSFRWAYPYGTELEVRPLPPATRRKK